MPYIDKMRRGALRGLGEKPQTAGELNFSFCMMALDYIELKGEKYQNWNDVIGALEGAKIELYRRFVAPYEDLKCKENGDIK